jgi:hypothetical protein
VDAIFVSGALVSTEEMALALLEEALDWGSGSAFAFPFSVVTGVRGTGVEGVGVDGAVTGGVAFFVGLDPPALRADDFGAGLVIG